MKQAFDIIPFWLLQKRSPGLIQNRIFIHTRSIFAKQECCVIPSPHSIHNETHTQHPTRPQPPHQTPSNQETQTRHRRRGRSRRRLWLLPHQVGSLPFWSASVLLKFARNWRSQCAMTCDCHCDPWPMGGDEWKGDNRLV